MQLGKIDLSRMDTGTAERIRRAGHEVIDSDRDPIVSEAADDDRHVGGSKSG